MPALPLTRRHLLGGGLLLAGGWALAQTAGHWPLAPLASPFLGASAHRTLRAVFEAYLPADVDAAPLADDVDGFLANGDPVVGGQLRLALNVLEHLGGAGPLAFRRFSLQTPQRRVEILEAWRRSGSGTKRQIAVALRKVVMFTWYANPASWSRIGYDGPLVGR